MGTGKGSYTIRLGMVGILLWMLIWAGSVAAFLYALVHFTLKYW